MVSQDEVDSLVSKIQGLKNRELISICVRNQLSKSGNKADLQKRIIILIDSAVADPSPEKFNSVRNSILGVIDGSTGASAHRLPFFSSTASLPPSPSYSNSPSGMSSPFNGHGTHVKTLSGTSQQPMAGAGYVAGLGRSSFPVLQFKPSPFYDFVSPIGDVRPCEAMSQHRNSIDISLRASALPGMEDCLTDKTLRIMVFCAAASTGVQDIAFPYQCEIKVNGCEVKANLRGLKNKPGSTRPVDITGYLRLRPRFYSNSFEFTYALTSKRFYLALYLCRTYLAVELAGQIEARARITEASVIRELTRQAQDPDIVATSQVLSLKCPLTYMRIGLPVRATTCKHIGCFDATSYLQLQEQGPQWLCPICSQPAPFELLAVDEYARNILANTPSDQNQVTIEPDGSWHSEKPRDALVRAPRASETSFVDDEDEELDFRLPLPRMAGALASNSSHSPLRQRAATATSTSTNTTQEPLSTPVSGNNNNNNNKRPREVIDLTLSDDEDESGPPVKRQNTGASYEPEWARGFPYT